MTYFKTTKRFYNFVTQTKLCPVVGANMKGGPPCSECKEKGHKVPTLKCPNYGRQKFPDKAGCPEYYGHALVIDSALPQLPGKRVRYYQCKNSWGGERSKVRVCSDRQEVDKVPYQHSSKELSLEHIFVAISIQFSKKNNCHNCVII